MHRSIKYLSLGLGIIPIGLLLINSSSAYAATSDAHIELTKQSEDSTLADIQPTSGEPSPGQYKSVYRLTASNVKDYAIYASTPDSNLVGTKDSNNKIPSMGSAQAISIGAIEANKWGFRANLDEEPTSYYTGVPVLAIEDQENKEALESTAKYIGGGVVAANTPVSRDIYLDVATRIDATIPADTYEGAIVLSVVATPAGATIFDINSMQEMTPEICSNTITPTATAAIPALDGGDTYQIPITDRAGRKDLVYNADNLTIVEGKYRTNIAVETYLMDTRDEKRYLVAKLADGRCWMIQNLALQSNDNKPKTVLAYNPTDGATFAYNLPTSSMTGFTNPDTGFMYNGSFQANTYNTQGYAGGQPAGDTNCNDNSSAGCDGSNSGSYYSWSAATANSGSDLAQYYNAPASICPKGWKLPTGGDRDSDNPQLRALYNAYGDRGTFIPAWHGSVNNTSVSFAGYFSGSDLKSSGVGANWWSGTAFSGDSAYNLRLNTSILDPANANRLSYGFSVRCVASTEDPTPVTAKTMQEFSKTDCSNLTGETELIDSRDNKVYKVAKLADNNCWMIQNLALEGGTVLTPETSDVTSNYPLPESSTTGFSDNSTAYVFNGTHIGKANNNKQIVEHAAYDTNGYDGTTTNDGANSGAYYSWLAAVAGNVSGNQSICPKGWRLPSGGNGGEFENLVTQYGSDVAQFQPIWKDPGFSGGVFMDNTLDNKNAGYWSGIPDGADHAKFIGIKEGSSKYTPTNTGLRKGGRFVRCVKTPN